MSRNSWGKSKLEGRFKLLYRNEREAEAIAKAISPDNMKAPAGLLVYTTREGAKVSTLVRCRTKLATFMATIDDLLCHVSIAEGVIHLTNKSQRVQAC